MQFIRKQGIPLSRNFSLEFFNFFFVVLWHVVSLAPLHASCVGVRGRELGVYECHTNPLSF